MKPSDEAVEAAQAAYTTVALEHHVKRIRRALEAAYKIDINPLLANLEQQLKTERKDKQNWLNTYQQKFRNQDTKLAELLSLLEKWHNWIATGQLNFTKEHLDESEAILKRAGSTRFVDRTKFK